MFMDNLKNKYNGIIKSDINVSRNKKIVRTSVIGIVTNFLLALFKAIVGLLRGSIAIVLDAINNVSDVASSIITIIGTKLAQKKPDKNHPFGHGRIEYLSSLVISIIIIYAGVSSFIESVKKIIMPNELNYSIFSIIVVVIAIFVKIILGLYVKNKGEELNSSSLVNSGNDALLDSVISFSTLLAALIFLISGYSTEAYLGLIISAIIIKSGVGMTKEAISSILGERVDIELVRMVKNTIISFPEVLGVYDIIFNNYGPNSYYGSVHIEIANTYTVDQVDELLRNITKKVYEENGVILSAIGIYSIDVTDKKAIKARKKISKVIEKYDNVLQMHGFYYNDTKKTIQFDIVVSFDEANQDVLYKKIYDEIIELYPDFNITIAIDSDFSVSI